MTRTFQRTFQVRFYECDLYGHVHNINYLRYMQETAFDASQAVGYGSDHYSALGRTWFVRQTNITYLAPLTYGDGVVVTTWVQDVRRVRSRRRYDLHRQSDGQQVARAETDWVYLDTTTGRPVRVPPEMIEAFDPEFGEENAPVRHFPAPPPAPPGLYRHALTVGWSDVDGAQHVNNAVYLSYAEAAGMAAATHYGWPMQRSAEMGVGIVAREHQLEYLGQARLGDEITIETYISDVTRISAVRHYRMLRASDGALLCRARTQWVWIDLQTGRPLRIPVDLLSDLAPHISAGPTDE